MWGLIDYIFADSRSSSLRKILNMIDIFPLIMYTTLFVLTHSEAKIQFRGSDAIGNSIR